MAARGTLHAFFGRKGGGSTKEGDGERHEVEANREKGGTSDSSTMISASLTDTDASCVAVKHGEDFKDTAAFGTDRPTAECSQKRKRSDGDGAREAPKLASLFQPRPASSDKQTTAALHEPRTICCWNANSLLSRIQIDRAKLSDFLKKHQPDALFISEVRMPAAAPAGAKVGDGKPRRHSALATTSKSAREEAELILSFVRSHGYKAYWSLCEKKYAGTALLVRTCCIQPRALRFNLDLCAPASEHDKDGRVILATFDSFELLGQYVPNNGTSADSFARRRHWDKQVETFLLARQAQKAGGLEGSKPLGPAATDAAAAGGAPSADAQSGAGCLPIVWVGDMNVAAEWHDVGPDPGWFRNENGKGAESAEDRGQPGFTINEQRRFARIKELGGFDDAYRLLHPTRDWDADCTWRGSPGTAPNPPEFGRYYGKGMRIDYLLTQASLRPRVRRAEVLGCGKDRHGFLGSDHAPLLLELADACHE